MSLKQSMQALTCCRCGKPATIGEMDDAIGSFLACSDECHAAELAERTATYADESAGVYERKRERIAAIRSGKIQHPGYVAIEGALDSALARIEAAGAQRVKIDAHN